MPSRPRPISAHATRAPSNQTVQDIAGIDALTVIPISAAREPISAAIGTTIGSTADPATVGTVSEGTEDAGQAHEPSPRTCCAVEVATPASRATRHVASSIAGRRDQRPMAHAVPSKRVECTR